VKAIRQFVSFVLGVTIGVCLYSLLKLRPLTPPRLSNDWSQTGANHLGKSLRLPWVQRSLPPQVVRHARVHLVNHSVVKSHRFAKVGSSVRTNPTIRKLVGHGAPQEVAATNVPSAPIRSAAGPSPRLSSVPHAPGALPAPTVFKTIGYVEKAGGQLEAIILQENQVQVVHIGEHIAGRYLVTKITPDLVDTVDETESPMANIGVGKSDGLTTNVTDRVTSLPSAAPARPEPTGVAAEAVHSMHLQGKEEPEKSLGYVEQADGKVESVVADGESVRLIPETTTSSSMAQVNPPAGLQKPAAPTQGSNPPVAPAVSAVGAMANHPMRWGGLPDGGAIRQASYQVSNSTPIADESAGSSLSGNVITRETMGALQCENNAAAGGPRANPLGSTGRSAAPPIVLKPLGFVVRADGQFSAILSQDDEIYIVREGDLFAGRYRALSVSADAVEALEEPPRQTVPLPFVASPAFADSLSASAREAPSFVSGGECSGCKSNELGEVPGNVTEGHLRGTAVHPVIDDRQAPDGLKQTDSATFIFQTLGYVQAQGGEVQAIVADGPETYLVKQGDTFADQYQATSVDPILVLAVKVSNGRHRGDILSARTDSGTNPASNNLQRHFPLSHPDGPSAGPEGSPSQNGLATLEIASGHAFHNVDLSGDLVFGDWGTDLLSSASTGFDLKSLFFMADNPKVGF